MNIDVLTDRLSLAWKASNDAEVLSITNQLIESKSSSARGVAYMVRGGLFEFGGSSTDADLAEALRCYRHAATICEDMGPFLHMANVLMKVGGEESYRRAGDCLAEAKQRGGGAALYLALGMWHECSPKPDLRSARKYYLKAICAGKSRAFFGCSSAARSEGLHLRAMLSDVMRVLMGPLFFLLLGRRSSQLY